MLKPFRMLVQNYSRTAGERKEIDNIMKLVLFVQRIFGHQIFDPKWTWKRFLHNHILTIFILVYVVLGTIDVLKKATGVQSIAEGYYTIIITSIFPIKCLIFVNYKHTFQQLYVAVKTTLFDIIKEDSNEKLNEVLQKCRIVVRLLFAMIFCPVVMYILTAMYNYVMGRRVTLSKTTSILMPMTTPYYEIGLILHIIYLFEMAFTFLVIDMWYVLLMYFYCVAGDSLVNILTVERKEDTDEMYKEKLNETLRRFYTAHKKQMEYLNVLNKLFKWATAIPLCKVLICTCLLLLLMSEEFNWKFSSNMVPTFAEIFAYNWFGEQIKTKAAILKKTLSEFDWTNMRLRDKKNYLIIITYMNKEFGIKTIFGPHLSLLTMSSVIKGSYQAFAVLKSMEE